MKRVMPAMLTTGAILALAGSAYAAASPDAAGAVDRYREATASATAALAAGPARSSRSRAALGELIGAAAEAARSVEAVTVTTPDERRYRALAVAALDRTRSVTVDLASGRIGAGEWRSRTAVLARGVDAGVEHIAVASSGADGDGRSWLWLALAPAMAGTAACAVGLGRTTGRRMGRGRSHATV
jgi:hypothetical protein